MMKMHEWVKEAREKSGMSGRKLSHALIERLGKESQDQSLISKMSKAPTGTGKPRRVTLEEIIAISDLTGHPIPDEIRAAAGVGMPEHVPVVTDVPLIAWVSAGNLESPESQVELEDAPKISAIDLPDGDYIALRVQGASMNKISPPESVIFVNRNDTRLVANACYVVADETGKATYKRYRPKQSPQFQPVSFDKIAAPELKGEVRVIGRVRRTVLDL